MTQELKQIGVSFNISAMRILTIKNYVQIIIFTRNPSDGALFTTASDMRAYSFTKRDFIIYTFCEVCEVLQKIILGGEHWVVVLRKNLSENIQQIYRRTPMPSNFIEITLRHECSPVNLLHIFRTPFLKNFSGRLLLKIKIYSTKNI